MGVGDQAMFRGRRRAEGRQGRLPGGGILGLVAGAEGLGREGLGGHREGTGGCEGTGGHGGDWTAAGTVAPVRTVVVLRAQLADGWVD